MRKQSGTICQFSGKWYLRYYDLRNVDGVVLRKRLSTCLGQKVTRGNTVPADIKETAEAFMSKINNSKIPVMHNMTFATFVNGVYLDWIEQNRRPSTYKDAKDVWELHIKPIVKYKEFADLTLKDVRTYHIQKWLNQVAKEDLARNTLKRIKSFLSGAFTQAKQQGYLDSLNPVAGTSISPHLREPEEIEAYDLKEITATLLAFPEPSRTAFGVAAFSGLRRGEIEGLDWSDYHDGQLHVNRSVSRIGGLHELPPKTKKSRAPVPVIGPLRELLDMYHMRCGNPQSGPMFATGIRTRICLDNLRTRQILPALNRCKHCGVSQGKPHCKADHKFERDERLPSWRGWHAARSGVGTTLDHLGVSLKTISRILRHSNTSVTLNHYIKPKLDDVISEMEKFEAEIAIHGELDSKRTVNRTVRSQPKSVN